MASAWKEDTTKAKICVNGKKTSPLKFKPMPHKNKLVAKAKAHNVYSGQDRTTIKIKQPEGLYEIKFGIVWKAGQKVKGVKKNPLPPDCPLDSVAEFTELRIFVESVKLPMLHTCEVIAGLNRVKNYGSKTDMDPVAMLDIDIKTGSMVPGTKWVSHLECADVYSLSGKVRNFK